MLSVIRQKVLAAFQALGAGDGNCSEAFLVNGGHVVGRRFRLGGFDAIWLAGEQIRIVNEAGELIDALALEEVPLRKAA